VFAARLQSSQIVIDSSEVKEKRNLKSQKNYLDTGKKAYK